MASEARLKQSLVPLTSGLTRLGQELRQVEDRAEVRLRVCVEVGDESEAITTLSSLLLPLFATLASEGVPFRNVSIACCLEMGKG